MIAATTAKVETLLNCSTLLTVVITRSGGEIGRMLMGSEARAMFRSDLRSSSTSWTSQRRLNGASLATWLPWVRTARNNTASPAQTSDILSSSTVTGGVPGAA